uniref:C2H2-type domain-containing protein n=1 Tax=Angiostrongylus cantonensis TaxID=6313 RepID=A0A0K0DMN7_ANGCA
MNQFRNSSQLQTNSDATAERENRDGGSDVSLQVPPMLRENETVSPSETTTLFCGLDGCSQCFADSEKLCRHLQLAHSLPTYVVTIDFTTRMEYLGFRKECLSNGFFHKMVVDGNYAVYTCQRLLPGGMMTALRLVEATRICDWHLHGSVIPTRALEMIGTMLLLKNIPLPVVRMIIQGQTTELCTPMSSLDLYIRRLDLKQFEYLCEFVRERYAGHVDLLKGERGYLKLTPFERSCMTEYSTQQRAIKAKYMKKVDLAGGSSHVNDHHVTEEGAPPNNVQRTYKSGNTQRGKKRKCRSFSNESKRCNKK